MIIFSEELDKMLIRHCQDREHFIQTILNQIVKRKVTIIRIILHTKIIVHK